MSVLLDGCRTARIHYSCTTIITPDEEADFYDVVFELSEIHATPVGMIIYDSYLHKILTFAHS